MLAGSLEGASHELSADQPCARQTREEACLKQGQLTLGVLQQGLV